MTRVRLKESGSVDVWRFLVLLSSFVSYKFLLKQILTQIWIQVVCDMTPSPGTLVSQWRKREDEKDARQEVSHEP